MQKGFTLIELVTGMVVVTIIAFAIVYFVKK